MGLVVLTAKMHTYSYVERPHVLTPPCCHCFDLAPKRSRQLRARLLAEPSDRAWDVQKGFKLCRRKKRWACSRPNRLIASQAFAEAIKSNVRRVAYYSTSVYGTAGQHIGSDAVASQKVPCVRFGRFQRAPTISNPDKLASSLSSAGTRGRMTHEYGSWL
jgi:hypothetical protein